MTSWFASLLFVTASIAQTPAAPKPAAPAAPQPFDRVAVLGASLSECFGVEPEIGAPVWIGDVLRAALKHEVEAPRRHSSLLFFTAPRMLGPKAASDALAAEPTFVLALDWLFWFGYGEFPSDEKRMESFELGLKQLEPFRCPVLVGDLPDMRGALDGVPKMLQESQVPRVETLAAMNARLAQWAKEREHVVLAPLAELTAKIQAGKEFLLRGNAIHASELPELLQGDKLHPTAMGTIVVWIAAADALVKKRADVPAAWFEWNRQQIYRRLYAAQEPARKAKLLERQKKFERENPYKPPPPPDPAEVERKRRGGDDGG